MPVIPLRRTDLRVEGQPALRPSTQRSVRRKEMTGMVRAFGSWSAHAAPANPPRLCAPTHSKRRDRYVR